VSTVAQNSGAGEASWHTIKRSFVVSLYCALKQSGIDCCVLRGYEGVATGSGDVDLLADVSDFTRIVRVFIECCDEHELFTVKTAVRTKSLYLTAVKVGRANGCSDSIKKIEIHIVAFVSIHRTAWQRRIMGLATRFWLRDLPTRIYQEDDYCIRVPEKVHEFVFLLHHMSVKPKTEYRDRCRLLLQDGAVESAMTKGLGADGVQQLAMLIEGGLPREDANRLLARAGNAIRRRRRPLAVARVMLNHFRYLYRQSGLIVFFVGPDGAGKTTTSTILAELLELSGLRVRRTKNLYYLNRKSRLAGRINAAVRGIDRRDTKLVERDRGGGASWRMRRMLGLISIVAQYFPGFWYARLFGTRKHQYIIDTSVLDAFVKGHRPKFVWLERLLLPVLPAGDLYFVLTAAPEMIAKRKPELTVAELDDYYNRLTRYLELASIEPVQVTADEGIDVVCERVFRTFLLHYHNVLKRRWCGRTLTAL